jgi:hypothetical protein
LYIRNNAGWSTVAQSFSTVVNKRPDVWASIVLAALLLSACSRVSSKKVKLSANGANGQSTLQTLAARKVYRYSVVPGGVYSSDELAASRRADPVVRAHYADFRSTATVTSLPADAFVYVSYRKANRVYWTSSKHKIPKGERVLTDGKNLARTRCGNRLSYSPMQPTLNLGEPGAQALDRPEEPTLAYVPDGPLLFPEGGFPDLMLPDQLVPAAGASGASPAAVPAALRAANDLAGPGYFPQLFPVAASAPLFALAPAATTPGGGTGTGSDTGPVAGTPGIPSSAPEPAAICLVLAAAAVFSLRRFRS